MLLLAHQISSKPWLSLIKVCTASTTHRLIFKFEGPETENQNCENLYEHKSL